MENGTVHETLLALQHDPAWLQLQIELFNLDSYLRFTKLEAIRFQDVLTTLHDLAKRRDALLLTRPALAHPGGMYGSHPGTTLSDTSLSDSRRNAAASDGDSDDEAPAPSRHDPEGLGLHPD